MFKKKPNIKNLAPLRSSDRRKVVDDIISTYEIAIPGSTETDGQPANGLSQIRNALLPDGALSAKFSTSVGADLKTVTGTIFVGNFEGDEQRILWIRVQDRTIPTVYTLWKNPGLLPLLHTPDIVLEKIRGGADLMTPGLANGPPFPSKAIKGAMVAIAALENPSVPLAAGECEIDVSTLQSARGAKGHAVKTLHWHGDEIWNWSQIDRPGLSPPNEINGWLQKDRDEELDRAQAMIDDLALGDEEDGGVPVHDTSTIVQNGEEGLADQAPQREWNTKDIDDAFRKALIYSIYEAKRSHRNEPKCGVDLPIDQSRFMSNHVLPYLPIFNAHDAEALQIKKTSWKSVKKFIKTLDKEVLLKCKERQGGEIVVLDIDFNDQAILSFTPYSLPKKQNTTGSTAPADSNSTTDDSVGQSLKRLTLLKPVERIAPLLKVAKAHRADLYTAPELREIIKTYIEAENLINEKNKRLVNINPMLNNAVFDPSVAIDAEVIQKGSIPRDTLFDRIISRCTTSYWTILQNNQDHTSIKPKAGSAPNVKITLETRSGNKTVTRVSGLEFYHIKPSLFKDELQKVCASSTTMGLLTGSSPKDNLQEIMLQGPQKDAVFKALEKRGVRKEWVDVIDKVKKKK